MKNNLIQTILFLALMSPILSQESEIKSIENFELLRIVGQTLGGRQLSSKHKHPFKMIRFIKLMLRQPFLVIGM